MADLLAVPITSLTDSQKLTFLIQHAFRMEQAMSDLNTSVAELAVAVSGVVARATDTIEALHADVDAGNAVLAATLAADVTEDAAYQARIAELEAALAASVAASQAAADAVSAQTDALNAAFAPPVAIEPAPVDPPVEPPAV